MKKQLVIGTAFLLILIGLCGCNERVPTSNNNEQQEPLTEYQEWQMQHFGSIDSEIAHYTDDPDNDYVDNLFEYENGTNPLSEYTYEGLDDFNLLYTYPHYITNFSDSNLTQQEINDLLEKIPNVEPRYWTNLEGDAVPTYQNLKYNTISLKDPLVKYYADLVNIEWDHEDDYGLKGLLKLGDEPLHGGSDIYYEINSSIPKCMSPPVYYLSHRRQGTCVPTHTALAVVLLLNDYKCTLCECDATPDDGEERIDHAFLEVYINQEFYVINYNNIYERDIFYSKSNWILNDRYDPNWLENENYNYM